MEDSKKIQKEADRLIGRILSKAEREYPNWESKSYVEKLDFIITVIRKAIELKAI